MVADILQINTESEVDEASWITCFGAEYRSVLMVCSKLENRMPVFSQIKDIVVVDEDEDSCNRRFLDTWFWSTFSFLSCARDGC